mgnify:CR=1 FL=1
MNRMFVCLLASLVLLLAVASAPLAAQETQDIYVIKSGDSAWRIAGDILGNPTLWRQVVEKNPFLKEKGRVTVNPKNGWTYVMMHPGEQLSGLQELGIIAPTPTPLNELGLHFPPAPTIWEQIPTWF